MTIKKYSVYCIVDNCVFEAEKSVQIYCWVQHSIRTFPKINQKKDSQYRNVNYKTVDTSNL